MEARTVKRRLGASFLSRSRSMVTRYKLSEITAPAKEAGSPWIKRLEEHFGESASQRITDSEKIRALLSYLDFLDAFPSAYDNGLPTKCREKVSEGIIRFIWGNLPPKLRNSVLREAVIERDTRNKTVLSAEKERLMKNIEEGFAIEPILKSCDTTLEAHQAACMGILGRAYEHGLFGIKKDPELAVTLYRLATILRCPMATYRLALYLEKGIFVPRNLEKAFHLYRVGYKLGYTPAIHRYALTLLRGNDYVSRDIMTGYHLLKTAADRAKREYPHPLYDFGMLLSIPNDFFSPDPRYAFQIFMKGARLGCNRCQLQLAKNYDQGKTVKMDPFKAFFWYKVAAEHGNAEAQYFLASLLPGSEHKPKLGRRHYKINFYKFFPRNADLERIRWTMLTKSASAGNPQAILEVALTLEKGGVVEKNILLSLWYYKIAKALDVQDLDEKIRNIESMLIPQETERLVKRKPFELFRAFVRCFFS